MTPSDAERRRDKRVPATQLPCSIQDPDGEASPFDLIDLSESGARIRCDHAIAPMTRIRVAMLLPAARIGADDDLRFDTDGVVVWSHATEGGRFDTGVFFPELDGTTRDALRTYVHSAV